MINIGNSSNREFYNVAGNYNFTVPSNVKFVFVTLVGGGGGGRYVPGSSSSGNEYAGAGGATVFRRMVAVTEFENIPLVVGAGGAPTVATGNIGNGVAGGLSSFGGLSAAGGGGGVNSPSNPAQGGVSSHNAIFNGSSPSSRTKGGDSFVYQNPAASIPGNCGSGGGAVFNNAFKGGDGLVLIEW